MMETWRTYLFSVIICSLSCGIVSEILSDSAGRKTMHLAGGIITVIVLLTPLNKIRPDALFRMPLQHWESAADYIAEGEQVSSAARTGCIKASCEEYILNQAKALGAEIKVSFTLNEEQLPVFAEIVSNADPNVQGKLTEILTADLGIPKENQTWIWNQEGSSSLLP